MNTLKYIEQHEIKSFYDFLTSNNYLPKNIDLNKLDLFIDANGIIHVDGRLQKIWFSYW